MNLRRTSFLLVFLVMAAGLGCASSGSSAGTGGVMSGLDDCSNLYPPVTSGYGYRYSNYGSAFYDYDDGLCSAYPRFDGYYPEYVVQNTSRQVTSAEGRDHHGTVVSRGEPQGWGSRSGDGSSGSSYSGSGSSSGSGDWGTVPRMEPIPVNSPSPSQGSPGPGTVTVQPRDH